MKTLLIVLLSLVVGFCAGVAVTRPSLQKLRVELAAKEDERVRINAEEALAVKQLQLCTSTLQMQNAQLRQNNQVMGDLIQRKRKE